MSSKDQLCTTCGRWSATTRIVDTFDGDGPLPTCTTCTPMHGGEYPFGSPGEQFYFALRDLDHYLDGARMALHRVEQLASQLIPAPTNQEATP